MRSTCTLVVLAALVLPMLAAGAVGQEDAPPGEQPGAAEMHPAVLLGRRAGAQLAAREVIPVVVVVSEPASYAEAIAQWTPTTFFPVLIDDGTWETSEDIARFVRGFKPDGVVRWSMDDAPPLSMRPARAVARARRLCESALARSWGVDAEPDELTGALTARWVELGRAPAGVVVTDERDPAWTAALALAAGRGQPLMWAEPPKRQVNGALSTAEIDAFCAEIEVFCAGGRVAWEGLGDVIDAVTVCASLPGRVQRAGDDFIATTDRLGRRRDGTRWAWAGQVFGSEPKAAYRAMCSLFLDIRTAWLFDTYDSTQPWVQYDCTAAAEALRGVGMMTMVDDEPRNRLGDWRLRAERPVRADLVLVNSSGNRSWFNVGSERGQAGDLPVLEVPSVVHIVHSWSAVAPARRATVAGRFLERGAYAYVGSVHEPYLDAFVPTPLLASRLVSGAALGAAARTDRRGLWRIAVIADPLVAYRGPSRRLAPELPLEGVEPVEETMKTAVKEGRFADAIAGLSLLGRDSDVARLVGGLLRDRPGAFDREAARAALFALFRTGMDDEFIQGYGMLDPVAGADGAAVDALWHVGRRMAREGGEFRAGALTLMASHVREEQRDADAAELSGLGAGRP